MDQHNHSVTCICKLIFFCPHLEKSGSKLSNMDIAESMQKLTPEQQKLFIKKLAEAIAAAAKKFGQEIEKYQKDPYVHFNGMKIKKTLKQCIPYTEEQWEKVMEKQRMYKNKQLINFIDKVFFEDGAVQFKETRHKGINND